MTPPKSELRHIIEQNGLEHTGLSQRAIQGVKRLGRFVQEHPVLTAQVVIGLGGYIAEVTANQALHPEWGIIANVFSPINLSVSPVSGQLLWNAIQGMGHTIFLAGGATGALSGAKEVLENVTNAPNIRRGIANNPYERMTLMVDKTNEAREGSTHGDFYNELYRYLLQHPNLLKKFIKKYGPICEITPSDVPEPTEKEPIPRYFRAYDPSNTQLLQDVVKADRTQATISVLMSRSHTVWDSKLAPSQDVLDTIDNMNATITDTLGAGNIPKLTITNNNNIITHGAFDPARGESITDDVPAGKYFTDKDYKVIVAEKEVMIDLISTFRTKKYRKVILMNDGTEDGKRIASNWLADYKRIQAESENVDLPEIIDVPPGKLGESLKERDYDGIFLIGAEDKRVNEAARAIFERQIDTSAETEGYRKVPMEILMEGRGSADKLDQITQNNGGIHFVHEILARKAIDILLEEGK